MQAAEKKDKYSYEGYLELENTTQQRWEFYFGEVFAMAGGSMRHNRIIGNIRRLLEEGAGRNGWEVYAENVRLELVSRKRYVYPDLMLTCHPADLADDTGSAAQFPSLLVEVLSETTEAYDQGEKRLAYFQLESLQYYVLVWQKIYTVEIFERKEGFWHYRNHTFLEKHADLPLLGLSLPLSAIYRQVAIDETT
jgi:Uma2 family endonuclease